MGRAIARCYDDGVVSRPARARRPAAPGQAPAPGGDDDRPRLRLAMSRGGLGLELDRPFALGPLRVERLAQRFEGLRFPLDLSEGVPRFRHRRGTLVEISLSLDPVALVASLAPRLREAVGASGELFVDPLPDGARLCAAWGEAALAVDLVVVHAHPERLLVVPTAARGLGLGDSPHAVALRLLRALSRPVGGIEGGACVVERPLARLGRDLLPLAGGRVPATGGLVLRVVPAREGALELEGFDVGVAPTSERAASALELLSLAGPGDDALLAGRPDDARARWVDALERAPRHPALVERIAWVDLAADRAESALALLVDVRSVTSAGVLGGELLARIGDADGAFAAFGAAAAGEPFGRLAARAWLRAAEHAPDARARVEALAEARARAPGLAEAHWARLEALAALGDGRGAFAAAEELEAAARGAEARRHAWLRAAAALAREGLAREAKQAFERALRYAPDDAAATRGLAMAARELGEGRRALELLQRAASLEERGGGVSDETSCALGEALAELAEDRPAAIARLGRVRAGSPLAPRARRIEAELREQLGDGAGARHALGRLGEQAERRTGARGTAAAAGGPDGRAEAALAEELAAGARLAESLGDEPLARRLAGLALRLTPRDRLLLAMVRRLGDAARAAVETTKTGTVRAPRDRAAELPSTPPPAPPPDAEARAAQLEDRLRADPSDEAVVRELARLLAHLGRDLDLVALASARLEEGVVPELAEELRAHRVGALQRLARLARDAGNASEADLYEEMAARG